MFATADTNKDRLFHNPSLPEETARDALDDAELEQVFSEDREVEYREDSEEMPPITWYSIRRYAVTRFTSLAHVHSVSWHNLNPIPELRKMSLQNWNYFFMGYLAWLCAAWAFFCVSVSAGSLSQLYGKSTHDITWGLSLVLFVRSAGAVIFGFWTDRYSRKWPFIACLLIFAVAQLCTPFCDTYNKFLGVRWLTGISMGGIYACASATAIEDAPVKARSFLSGLFFSAYAMGFIFAIIFNRAFIHVNGADSWKIQFWFSTFLPVLLSAWRLLWPETRYFSKVLKARTLMQRDAIEANGGRPLPKISAGERFQKVKATVRKYWIHFVYLVILLVGPNYLTHSSQDLLPTMLRSQLGLSEDAVTVIVVVTNIGAICGGMIFGQLMEITGRRLSLLIACTMGGCFIYPAFMLRTKEAILGAGFMAYFCVFAVWGVLPIHMAELAPADARALVSGLAYQLGNLASAASATIETQLADRFPYEKNAQGETTKHDYAKVMAILTGAVFIFTFVCVFVGHEKFHRDLSSPVMKKYISEVETLEADGVSINEYVDKEMKLESTAMNLCDSSVSKTSEEQIERV
ncbi:hypothetical protein HG536_0H04800 [Torulaspora globosa]|uniref:Major facilitator superfamily (MFS) profile domain-containing protein n=1 Tax=Torulaspora globosa TaxID=48254 RepID=A0A7G3ZNL8_9SACH|nr:uncharacterized protein HG536_0H04800 [Torulaspora globosa]QLL35104.1 hypothetical protein HG536_0H04800 [Torulaspora globosa]